MRIEEHLAKAERFETSGNKIPFDAYEMVIWNRMHAGTNYLNAALRAGPGKLDRPISDRTAPQ